MRRNLKVSEEMRAQLAKEYIRIFGAFNSKAAAARYVGVTEKDIHLYTTGKRVMTKVVAQRVAEKLGVDAKPLSAEMLQEEEQELRLKALREEGGGGA